jgi:hypothetical protein
MIVLAARSVTRQYKKMRREAGSTYVRLRKTQPELAQRVAEAGYAASGMSAASPASSSSRGATYNALGMGLDTSSSDLAGEDEAVDSNIATSEINESLEEELEFALDVDPALRAQIDPEGQLASLRDDLELIFWSLVKYGQMYPLGVGQAKVVAQLLGKDYSSELEQAGLFSRSGGPSVAGSASDVGSWAEKSPAQFAQPMRAPAAPQAAPQPVPQQGYGGAAPGFARAPVQGAQPSLFHPTEGGYRLGSFHLDRPQVSDYYPAHAAHFAPTHK